MSCADPITETYQMVKISVDARRSERGCKAAIAEFARFVGLSERRIHAIYYGQATRLWADEYVALRVKVREWNKAGLAKQEARIANLRAEYSAWGDAD